MGEKIYITLWYFVVVILSYGDNVPSLKYSKTSLNRPVTGPILNGLFREVVGFDEFKYHYGRSFGT